MFSFSARIITSAFTRSEHTIRTGIHRLKIEDSRYKLRAALNKWRLETAEREYGSGVVHEFGGSLVLPNGCLDIIVDGAFRRIIHGIKDLQRRTRYRDISKYGKEILDIIRETYPEAFEPFPKEPNSFRLKLPIELWERVIDNLNGDLDLDTLRDCSLVCGAWSPRSRRHYHRVLVLSGKALLSIQSLPSSISGLIREVHLRYPDYPARPSLENGDSHICLDPQLRIKTLRIFSLYWKLFPVEKQVILDLCGNLRTLIIHRMYFSDSEYFVSMLQNAPNLQVLEVVDGRVRPRAAGSHSNVNPTTKDLVTVLSRLTRLTLNNCVPSIVSGVVSLPIIQSGHGVIKEMVWGSDSVATSESLPPLLASIGSSLESLTVTMDFNYESASAALSPKGVEKCTNIRELRLLIPRFSCRDIASVCNVDISECEWIKDTLSQC
ncbi:hypothetical protein ABKN59_009318, partial [Abortiporus biennis]